MVGVFVAEGDEGLLEGLGARAGEAHADNLHWLGGGTGSCGSGVVEGINVGFKKVPEGVVERDVDPREGG